MSSEKSESSGLRLLSIKEAVARLAISRAGFYNLLKDDPTFPKLVRMGRATRVVESQLDAYILARQLDASEG